MIGEKEAQVRTLPASSVSTELYEDLLSRYEKALVYAVQLQERNRQQLLIEERARSLESENERLRHAVGVDEAYVKLLESALRSLGFFGSEK
jgi:hypothetical protein